MFTHWIIKEMRISLVMHAWIFFIILHEINRLLIIVIIVFACLLSLDLFVAWLAANVLCAILLLSLFLTVLNLLISDPVLAKADLVDVEARIIDITLSTELVILIIDELAIVLMSLLLPLLF